MSQDRQLGQLTFSEIEELANEEGITFNQAFGIIGKALFKLKEPAPTGGDPQCNKCPAVDYCKDDKIHCVHLKGGDTS